MSAGGTLQGCAARKRSIWGCFRLVNKAPALLLHLCLLRSRRVSDPKPTGRLPVNKVQQRDPGQGGVGQGAKAEWLAGPGLWLGSEDCAKGGVALFLVRREPRAASGLYLIVGTLAARRRTTSRKTPGAGRPDWGLSEGP